LLYSVLYLLAMQQVYLNTKGKACNPLLRAYFESKVSMEIRMDITICTQRKEK